MQKNHRKNVLCIVGPTGVGKTETGFHVAGEIGGEIISADSRQMYKYMDIGTDKPPPEYLKKVTHHFIDAFEPDVHYNAGQFGKDARKVIEEIHNRKNIPLIVGGSGLYLKALLEGFFDEIVKDKSVKRQLQREILERGNEELYNELLSVDPDFAGKITVNDSQRIIRGLEVFRVSGRPLTYHWQASRISADFDSIVFGLTMDRDIMYENINNRVESMIEKGLIDEVSTLLERGYSKSLNALQTYGYQEVFEYLENRITRDEMVDKIKKRTRNFAKRQMTWFRKMKGVIWVTVGDSKDKAARYIVSSFKNWNARADSSQ